MTTSRIVVLLTAVSTLTAVATVAATGNTRTSAAPAAASTGTQLVSQTPQNGETPPAGTTPRASATAGAKGSPSPTALASGKPGSNVSLQTLKVAIKPFYRSQASGIAIFLYDPTRSVTAVRLQMQHLPNNHQHPAFLIGSRCGSAGPILVPFSPIQPDKSGKGDSTAQVVGRVGGHGWSVVVNTGPAQFAGPDFFPIACGNVP